MKMKVVRSTLGELNDGRCGSPNNSRFTGKTVCWAVMAGEQVVVAYKRKRDADFVAAVLKEWDGVADPTMVAQRAAAAAGNWDVFRHLDEV